MCVYKTNLINKVIFHALNIHFIHLKLISLVNSIVEIYNTANEVLRQFW